MIDTKITDIKKNIIDKIYTDFDKKYNLKREDKFASLVNFSQHKELPFQRWHNYQEGYSPQLVIEIIKHIGIDFQKTTILDPFVGSGSTLVAAQEKGMKGIGIELNPFSYFMSLAKTKNYCSQSIELCEKFEIPKYRNIDNIFDEYELSMIERLYSKENLVKIELLRKSIEKLENENSKIILKSTLLSILEYCSNYKKGGNGLKKRKNVNSSDVFIEFNKKLKLVLEDIKSKKQSNIEVYNSNITDLKNIIEDNTIDLSVFSPPYANCFDYFEVYKIELWLGKFVKSYEHLKKLRKTALTSNLNANLKQEGTIEDISSSILEIVIGYINDLKLWDNRIPKMLILYFLEMQNVLKDLFDKQKNNSYCVIVVGNSSYGGVPVATDLILSEIAENCGFKVEEIIVARKNETSSQQYKKIGYLVKYIRESIIILKK